MKGRAKRTWADGRRSGQVIAAARLLPLACCRWRVLEYYTVRVRGSLHLLRQLDLIGRTSELARVFGFEFYSVLSRGSQYRVESMMLRTAKPKNYVAMSPSILFWLAFFRMFSSTVRSLISL